MLRELIPLVTALTLAGIVYLIREQRRSRRRIRPARPGIAMRELSQMPDFLEIEQACLAADHPRAAFRRAALESAVGALYLETIAALGVPGTAEPLHRSVETWQTLRAYLRLKYDDAVADDWFDHFVSIARPYIRERVRLTQEFALHLDEGTERFARIYDALLQDLLKEALVAPQKQTFVPPDLSHS